MRKRILTKWPKNIKRWLKRIFDLPFKRSINKIMLLTGRKRSTNLHSKQPEI